ncbi:MAG: copper chaperone PCu(A)C [Methyloceanibacter sp.]
MIEIGVALLLTIAALLFVGLTVWAAEGQGVRVTDVWVQPTVGDGRMTAAYLTITNAGAGGDVLKSASSPNAKSVELHQTTMSEDGKMQMRQVEDGLLIAPGEVIKLEPGKTHLMVMGLDEPLAAGDKLALTLEFAKAGAVEVLATVGTAAEAPAAEAPHAHHH